MLVVRLPVLRLAVPRAVPRRAAARARLPGGAPAALAPDLEVLAAAATGGQEISRHEIQIRQAKMLWRKNDP